MRGDQPVVSAASWMVRASIRAPNPNTFVSRLRSGPGLLDELQRAVPGGDDVEHADEPGELEDAPRRAARVDHDEPPALALDAPHRGGEGAEAGGVEEGRLREVHDDPALTVLQAATQPLLEGGRVPEVEVSRDRNDDDAAVVDPLISEGERISHALSILAHRRAWWGPPDDASQIHAQGDAG